MVNRLLARQLWPKADPILGWLLLIGLINCSLGCTGSKRPQALVHPATSLVAMEPQIAYHEFAWSPDENSLAAIGLHRCPIGRCSYGLYILDLQSGEQYAPTSVKGERFPSWTLSPEILSFARSGISGSEIVTLDLQSGQQTIVINGTRHAWSPNGAHLAFQSAERLSDGWIWNLIVHDLAPGQEVRLFRAPDNVREIDLTGLAWSHNSEQLAFSVTWLDPDAGYIAGLFVSKRDGTDLHFVGDDGWSPGWMPREDWLYFLSGDGILTFAPLNSECVLTPLDIVGIGSAIISPRGDRILFEHNGNLYFLNLFTLLGPNYEKLNC